MLEVGADALAKLSNRFAAGRSILDWVGAPTVVLLGIVFLDIEIGATLPLTYVPFFETIYGCGCKPG